MIIKLILICLSDSAFNFFIKMRNEKRAVLCFPFSYENEKQMKLSKIQRKNLLNKKIVVNYLNLIFLNEVKAKSKYRIFEFRFSIYQKHEMVLWVHGFSILFCDNETTVFANFSVYMTFNSLFLQDIIYFSKWLSLPSIRFCRAAGILLDLCSTLRISLDLKNCSFAVARPTQLWRRRLKIFYILLDL